jgi:hypothetical protein
MTWWEPVHYVVNDVAGNYVVIDVAGNYVVNDVAGIL